MFHKNSEKLESLIGVNSRFTGEIDTKGTIRIDGYVEGNIRADWVIIAEKSHVKGNIHARGIVVGGRIEGNLHAKEIVELKNKGQVNGEIFTTKLTVVEGALFEGRSSMHKLELKEDSKVIELPAKGN